MKTTEMYLFFTFVKFLSCFERDLQLHTYVIPNKKDLLEQAANYVTPVDVQKENITYYLYTRKCINHGPQVNFDCIKHPLPSRCGMDRCSYNTSKPNMFLIHGWGGAYKIEANQMVKNAILSVSDVNIFVVDWSVYAKYFNYIYAAKAVPQIGRIVGLFIKTMIDAYHLSPKMFKLIGYSLGAHIAGFAGTAVSEMVGKVDYVVGLDPAGPLFSTASPSERLNNKCANFVHVIHTNYFTLGIRNAIGHADYYVNSGKTQPGCIINRSGILDKLDIENFRVSCSHSRSYKYYAESVRSGGFLAKRCLSWNDFVDETCKNNNISHLPSVHVDRKASGNYYLRTEKREPFALGEKGILLEEGAKECF